MSDDNKANGQLSCKKERNELDGTGQQQQLLIATTRKQAGIEQYGEEVSVSLPTHKHMLCATKNGLQRQRKVRPQSCDCSTDNKDDENHDSDHDENVP